MEENRKIEDIYLDVSKLSQEQLKFLGENLKELYIVDRKKFLKGIYSDSPHTYGYSFMIWIDEEWACLDYTATDNRTEVSFNEFLEITNLLEEIGERFKDCYQETKIDLLDDEKLSKIAEILIYFDFESVSKINGHNIQELKKNALKLMDLAWRKVEQYQKNIVAQDEHFVCSVAYSEEGINLNLKHYTTEWSTNS